MLYGCFTLLSILTISLEANAIPNRIAAHPHALLNVFNTTKLGNLSRSSLNGLSFEKSEYASSTITMPSKFVIVLMISFLLILFPVGLFGEQIHINFVLSLHADNSWVEVV